MTRALAARGGTQIDKQTRLKVAVQKSGRLTDNSLGLLVRCGLKYSRGKDQLICYGESRDVLLVRDDDARSRSARRVRPRYCRTQRSRKKRLAFQARGVAPYSSS
jgi:ATP phosphoribosyltransferase